VLNLEYTRKAITDPNYSNIIMCLEKNDYKIITKEENDENDEK
jgi:hypothetical protein